jgi:hypothetical protein
MKLAALFLAASALIAGGIWISSGLVMFFGFVLAMSGALQIRV